MLHIAKKAFEMDFFKGKIVTKLTPIGCILQPVTFAEQTLGIMCLSLHSYRF